MSRRTAISAVVMYLIVLWIVVGLLWQGRRWALAQLSTSAARENWQQWREDVREARDPQASSVSRRVPKSSEPPALVLMRDHFGTCLVAATIFATLLYFVMVWFLRGAIGPANASRTPQGASGRQGTLR